MIYICIPTHNEQQTVGVVLWKLKQVLTDFPRDYQLLVADDASTDKTAEVLEPYTRVLPLTVIRSDQRQGSAASLEMLLREAVRRSEYPKRDAIITLQADFSEEPDDLVPLVKRLEAGADVAVGNKVSTSKDTRARRFARSLARFFMRRQKWPEGVMTPFDGYRAYRLYAVKRAMEERGTSRLLRFDGWAGHAEMLRAVLPHARRVDVVDIDDRPDRLQRPRRERPFAAAMQVRVMASGTEPERLVGVEELDRIALTTSRSRERAAITAQSLLAERGPSSRTNGSRTRQNGQRRDPSRTRSQSNGGARGGSSESRPRRERPQPADGQTRKKSGAQPSQTRAKRDDAQRQPRDSTVAAAEPAGPDPTAEPRAEGAVSPDAAPRPKRKRRRRKRGGQGRAANGQDQSGEQPSTGTDDGGTRGSTGSPDAAGAQSGDQNTGRGREASGREASGQEASGQEASGTDGAGEGAGAKKRRRRGGRRGGRGRRKPRPEGAAEPGVNNAGESGAESEGAASSTLTGRAEPSGSRAEPSGSGEGPARGESPAADHPRERPVERPADRQADRPVELSADRPAARPVAEPAARADND